MAGKAGLMTGERQLVGDRREESCDPLVVWDRQLENTPGDTSFELFLGLGSDEWSTGILGDCWGGGLETSRIADASGTPCFVLLEL